MKKLVKGLAALVFLFTLAFVFIASVKAAPVVTLQDGASLRTTGERQGIRFTANVDTLEGATEHGFLVKKGAADLEALKAGKEVEVIGTATQFSVVIYGMDSAEDYLAELSVVAYVTTAEGTVYSNVVGRNTAEVAMKAQNAGDASELVNSVVNTIEAGYKRVYKLGEGYSYLSSLYVDLETEFISDINKTLGLSLTTEMAVKDFYLAISGCPVDKYSTSKGSVNDISDAPLFKFFKDAEMNAKWSGVIEYLKTLGSGMPHVVNQSKALLNAVTFDGDRSDETDTYAYPFYYLEHIAVSFYNLLRNADVNIYFVSLKSDSFAANPYDEKGIITCDTAELVKVGEEISLPTVTIENGYELKNWTDGTNEYANDDKYTLTAADVTLTPNIEAISYNIKYTNGDVPAETENPATYTVEDKVVLEPLANKPGLSFDGWYDNPELAGEAVTEIAAGTTGEKEFYAKWVVGYETVVVNPAWASEAEGTVVSYAGKDYTVGLDAHATYAAAEALVQNPGNVILAAGTYADAITITKEGVTLTGEEVIVTGTITVAAEVDNVTIKGLTFNGAAQVVLAPSSTKGSAQVVAYNHENFVFENNVVYVSGQFLVINKDGAASNYDLNPQILNNTFEMSVTETSAVSLIYLDNTMDLKVLNNTFKNIPTDAFHHQDTTKGLSGLDVQISNNTFTNIKDRALYIDWFSPNYGSTTGVFKIDNNTFDIVNIAIYFYSCNNADKLTEFSISNNTFKGTIDTCVKFNKTVSGITYVVKGNTFLGEPTTSYFNITGVALNVVTNNYCDANGVTLETLTASKFTNVTYQ